MYCLTSALRGSVRMRTKSSRVSGSSSTRIGKRPCSSGIRSDGFETWNAPAAMNRMWSVFTIPCLVLTVVPSTIGRMSRCTPSRLTSGPWPPPAAVAAGDLVDLVDEDDAGLLDALHGGAADRLHVDELAPAPRRPGARAPRAPSGAASWCGRWNMLPIMSLRLTPISSTDDAGDDLERRHRGRRARRARRRARRGGRREAARASARACGSPARAGGRILAAASAAATAAAADRAAAPRRPRAPCP